MGILHRVPGCSATLHTFGCPEISRQWQKTVVGQEEFDARSVNIRNRDDVGIKGRAETIQLEDVVKKLVALKENRSLENKLV